MMQLRSPGARRSMHDIIRCILTQSLASGLNPILGMGDAHSRAKRQRAKAQCSAWSSRSTSSESGDGGQKTQGRRYHNLVHPALGFFFSQIPGGEKPNTMTYLNLPMKEMIDANRCKTGATVRIKTMSSQQKLFRNKNYVISTSTN